MKIALYRIDEYKNAFIFRLLDGRWTALRPRDVIRDTPEETWLLLSTTAGEACDGNDVINGEGFTCLTASREDAKNIYGIPDAVELYQQPVAPAGGFEILAPFVLPDDETEDTGNE